MIADVFQDWDRPLPEETEADRLRYRVLAEDAPDDPAEALAYWLSLFNQRSTPPLGGT